MIYLNGTPLNTTLFPDNTSQVWKLSELILNQSNYAHVKWEFTHEGEFMQLAQLKMLLDKYRFNTCLRIKYLPYGRQDKDVDNEATFALHSFAKLLNLLKFSEVIIHDPHSSIAVDIIDNAEAVYPVDEINKIVSETSPNIFCYPDNGAHIKYREIFDFPFVYGEKVRDPATGWIKSYRLIGLNDVRDRNILIVDDICDGGMTFKLLARDLLAAGAKEVNLFVTHGIFSKGLRTIKESGINRVFTQDGEVGEYQNNITYRRL